MEEKEITYKQAVMELEAIVAKMDSNELDLDSLAKYTSRALELLKFCKDRLFKIDTEVEKCLEELKSTLSE